MPRDDFSPEKADGLPRVPKADKNGVQEGRGAPPRRIYRSTPVVEDMAEAVANFNRRKRGEMPVIQGGLDDNDPALYDPDASIVSTTLKMKVAQHGALTDMDVARLKAGHAETNPLSVPEPAPPPAPSIQVAQIQTAESQQPRLRRPKSGQVVERIVERPVEKIVEKVVEKVVEKPVETAFSKWASGRIRVEVATPDTIFNIAAIDAVRSIHGLVLFLPTSSDSMTFIPKPGSNVKIRTQDLGVLDTVFTGVSFDMGDLGFMGICFLVREELPEG